MAKAVIISIVLVIIVLAVVYLVFQPKENPEEKTAQEQACLDSGGTVAETLCCQTTSDFPDTCLIGACGCSPDNSQKVKTCQCGEGSCFNGRECIEVESVEPPEDLSCSSPSGQMMALIEAEEIASTSQCAEQGIIEGENSCNENTGTWWLGFTPQEPEEGCNPACVVDIETREASINWRCTGLIE